MKEDGRWYERETPYFWDQFYEDNPLAGRIEDAAVKLLFVLILAAVGLVPVLI